jgi:hypothetical protein
MPAAAAAPLLGVIKIAAIEGHSLAMFKIPTAENLASALLP